jgi:hypothetical protein
VSQLVVNGVQVLEAVVSGTHSDSVILKKNIGQDYSRGHVKINLLNRLVFNTIKKLTRGGFHKSRAHGVKRTQIWEKIQ